MLLLKNLAAALSSLYQFPWEPEHQGYWGCKPGFDVAEGDDFLKRFRAVVGASAGARCRDTGVILVEHGFAALKNWRVLTRRRLNPARTTTLLRTLLVLTNLETSR